MNSLTIFDIPFSLTIIVPILGALALAWAGYLLGRQYLPEFKFKLGSKSRLDNFLDDRAAKGTARSSVQIGSWEHKVRIAFTSLKIDAAGSEEYYMTLATVVVGAGFMIMLMLIGLPFITSLAGLLAGRVFLDGWVTRSWNKVRADMESELPSLLLRLSSILQTTPNVPSALETVSTTLKRNGPLRTWAMETAARMHSEGYGVMDDVREHAAGISTSLAIAAELIGRVWTTGGEGYAKAFGAAADNLESVLDARVEARSKGTGAQGTVNILTVMTFGMIAFMMKSDAMADAVSLLIVQVLYAGISLLIVYGHRQVSELIDSVV
jgi:hypothetical protein